jgi:TetR/AcrR family transcriptional regulator, transcriptional repressor for nem operon
MTKAEKTKNFIVEQTAAIFNMKGYAGTSLTDLTEATGLTKGSIYGNFANKDEVALAVYDYNLARLEDGIKAAVATGTTATDKLLKMANFYRANFKNSMTRGGCPILNTAVEADDTHPGLKDKAAKSFTAWKKNIESIVKQGIAANEIKAGVSASEFATTFIALIEGGNVLAKATGSSTMMFTCIDRIEQMINTELKA